MDGSPHWVLADVAPEPERVAHVRRQAHRVLQSWALDEVAWAVELLLTELAGNVVRHARTPYDVTMSFDQHTLRVSVRDDSRTPPRPRVHVSPTESEGRGLLLVERLATRWGSEPDGHGKAVWFELLSPLPLEGLARSSLATVAVGTGVEPT
jgi:anti-sigma regulatory factor (Ser/Thr protein kinase)